MPSWTATCGAFHSVPGIAAEKGSQFLRQSRAVWRSKISAMGADPGADFPDPGLRHDIGNFVLGRDGFLGPLECIPEGRLEGLDDKNILDELAALGFPAAELVAISAAQTSHSASYTPSLAGRLMTSKDCPPVIATASPASTTQSLPAHRSRLRPRITTINVGCSMKIEVLTSSRRWRICAVAPTPRRWKIVRAGSGNDVDAIWKDLSTFMLEYAPWTNILLY